MDGSGYDLGNVYGKITLDASGIADGINHARRTLASGFADMGQSLQSFGDQLTGAGARITALTAPFTAFSASGLNVAAEFDVLLKQVEMFGGVTGAELESVRQYALQMGADTKFSAQDALGAMLDLLKGGMDLEATIATLPDVLNLAAAGEMSLAEAAGVVSGSMAIFKMDTENLNNALAEVPANFTELQNQLGITDEMFTEWGEGNDGFNYLLNSMASQLGTTTEELYDMWNATKPLTPEIEALANQLGISQADWEAYQGYLDGTASSLDVVTPAIQALIAQTGLSGERLAQMFNPQMSASERIVNALAQAANASRADVAGLSEAMENVGTIADDFGLEIEETSAILGVFAEGGMMGAEAGTQLRSMLTNLARPTDDVKAAWKELGVSLYDSEGNMRDFNTVMLELDAAMDALPVQRQNELTQILAGSFGQLGFSALRASNGIGDMLAEMESAPDAGLLAESFMDTFAGKVEGLRGSFETLKIEALTPFMNEVAGPFVERLTEMVNSVTEWASANPELTVTIMQIGSAIAVAGPALMGTGLAINNIGFAVKAVAPLFGLLTSPLGLIAGAGLVLAEVFDVDLRQAFEDVASAVMPALEEIRVWVVEEGFPAVVAFVRETLIPNIQRIGEIIGQLWERVAPVLGQLYNWFVTSALPAISGFVRNTFIPTLQRIGEIIGQVWVDIYPILAELFTWFVEDALPAVIQIVGETFIPIIEDIGTRIGEVWAVIEPVLRDLYNWFVTTALPAISNFIQTVFIPAVEGIAHIFSEIYQTVAPILQYIFTWFAEQGIPIIARIINEIVVPVFNTLFDVLGDIWEVVAPALQSFLDWFQTTGWPFIQSVIDNVITPAIHWVISLLAGIWEAISPHIENLKEFLEAAFIWIDENVFTFIEGAINGFIDIVEGIWTAIQPGLDSLKTTFESAFMWIKTEIFDKIIGPAIQGFIDFIGRVWTDIQPFLNELKRVFDEAFKWIDTYVIQPIIKAINSIPDAIKAVQNAIDDFLNNNSANKVNATAQQILAPGNLPNLQQNITTGSLTGDISQSPLNNTLIGQLGLFGGVIPPLKDNGGIGLADMPYFIGRPQEDNEIFVPRTDGQFIPGFMDKMNTLFERENTPTIGTVVIHANTEEGGRAAARGFVDEFEKWNRSRG